MIARLEREVNQFAPEAFVWRDPGPVLLERALGELGFDWNELEDIPQQHVHLGIPIREYPRTDLVYARALELQSAIEREEEEIVCHHLHSWVVEAHVEEGIWEDHAMWLDIRHVPDPVSYYSTKRSGATSSADVERAMASPGERFVGGRISRTR